jgi:hypothetical protein
MKKLRVSIVEFLNTAPLVWGFTDGPLAGRYDLSFTMPSLCAEALRAGEADIAIIPAVEYQRIPNLVLLPEMAVAAKNEVRSILLLAKKPVQLAKRIALDTSSRSSVALVRLLCRGFWNISPEKLWMQRRTRLRCWPTPMPRCSSEIPRCACAFRWTPCMPSTLLRRAAGAAMAMPTTCPFPAWTLCSYTTSPSSGAR